MKHTCACNNPLYHNKGHLTNFRYIWELARKGQSVGYTTVMLLHGRNYAYRTQFILHVFCHVYATNTRCTCTAKIKQSTLAVWLVHQWAKSIEESKGIRKCFPEYMFWWPQMTSLSNKPRKAHKMWVAVAWALHVYEGSRFYLMCMQQSTQRKGKAR